MRVCDLDSSYFFLVLLAADAFFCGNAVIAPKSPKTESFITSEAFARWTSNVQLTRALVIAL
jgi:hypothetical protein